MTTERERSSANELLSLGRRREKRIGALEHFPRLGRSKRLGLPHTSRSPRARLAASPPPFASSVSPHFRRGRVGGGGGGGVALGRLLRVSAVPPLRRRRFLWRRRSLRARPPASAAAAAVRGAAGRALDVRAVGAGDVDGLRARVVALLHLELDRFLLRVMGRERERMDGYGDLQSSGSVRVRLLTRRATEGRSRRKAPAGTFRRSTAAGRGEKGGMRGGVGRPTARARARARGRLARRGDGGARARGARRGGAKRVVMTGHWLGATGQPARGWEEKSRVARATHLAEAAKAVRVDGGLMDEDLVGAVVGGDEPEALLRVEPLHLREPGRSRGASTNRRTLLLVFFPSPRIARPARGGREATGFGSGDGAARRAPCR